MRRFKHSRSIQPVLRAVTVLSSVIILATGATYAALTSREAVLASSTIRTATADLKISASETNFSSTLNGFTFEEVVPGASSVAPTTGKFYLKNSGTPALDLKFSISAPPTNDSNVDLSKVYFLLTRQGSTVQRVSVSELVSQHTAGGVSLTDDLNGGATAQYSLEVMMDAEAFQGASADIAAIDLVFSGNAVVE